MRRGVTLRPSILPGAAGGPDTPAMNSTDDLPVADAFRNTPA